MDYTKPELTATYIVPELYRSGEGFFSAGGGIGDNKCDFGPLKDHGALNDNPGGPCGPH